MGVSIREVQAVATSGDQHFAIPGFGTPKAAVFTVTSCLTNGIIANHSNFSQGFTDGINHGVISGRSLDGLSSTNTGKVASSGSVVKIIRNSNLTIDAEATFKEWTSSGVTITWINEPNSACLVTCRLLTGDDLSAHVGNYTSPVFSGETIDISGVGFKPDMIFHNSVNSSFDDSALAGYDLHIGYSTRNTEDDSGQFNGSINNSQLNARPIGASISLRTSGYTLWDNSGLNETGAAEVTSYNDDGFILTQRFFSGNTESVYLAISFGGAVGFAAWAFDTPTSDGNSTDSGPGFKPQWVSYLMSRLTISEEAQNNASAGVLGISSFTDFESYSNVVMTEMGADPTNTASVSDNIPVFLPHDDQTSGITGLFSSMQSTGPELIWTNTPASALKWIGIAVGGGGMSEITGTTNLYIEGHDNIQTSCDLYLSGQTTGSPTGSIDLFVNGEVAIPAVTCPTLDPTASIQIKSALIAIYQSRIDALINQLGKNVRLIFDPVLTPCPNCLYDVLRKRSNGIYRTGGPRPFKRGRKCPYCKGKGLNETSVEKCIKCLLKWNPMDAENYGISISGKKGIVRMKTFLTSADDMIQAKTAIANYDIRSQMKLNVKLISGPIPVGLREDRYCISFWELL